MKKSELLQALQTEIRRGTFETFVDQPPSIAARREWSSYARLPGLPEADKYDGAVPRSSCGRCVAGSAGQAIRQPIVSESWPV